MTALVWDEAGKHYGETGADHGVIYRLGNSGAYDKAEVWNGLTAVNTEPEGQLEIGRASCRERV